MEYIEREISQSILEAYKAFPVITITGPRQSGKSTLARHLFSHLPYFNLENIDTRTRAAEDPRTFLNASAQGMIIDEAQRVPELFSYLLQIVDEHPGRRYILSGSSNFTLLKSVSQSLAGRAAVFTLLPLSISELKSHLPALPPARDLMFKGFYPGVWSADKPVRLYYPNYVSLYLERDVRELLQVKDLELFGRFLQLCAGRVGALFVASELAGELGISTHTVNSWLGVLQASYVVYMLRPFSDNIGKRLTKTPKLYFTDTGVLCSLLGIESADELALDRMTGHIFENMIVAEALKHRLNRASEPKLSFYRDSNGNEIDLLTRRGANGLKAFEIKSSATYHPRFADALRRADKVFGERLLDSAIVYSGEMTDTISSPKLLSLTNFTDFI